MQVQSDIQGITESVLVMREGSVCYGVHTVRVRQILSEISVTSMPMQLSCVCGIANFKGRIIPILSLGKICGEEAEERTCVIFEEKEQLYGLMVSNVERIVDGGQMEEGTQQEMKTGVVRFRKVIQAEEPVFILDMEKIMNGIMEGA